MDKSTISNDLLNLAADKVLHMYETFSKNKNTSIEVIGLDQAAKRVDHRSEIFLYGTDITIRLQVFYENQECAQSLKHLYDDITEDQIYDFFNELCNLTCGKLKEVLVEQGVVAALSLPIDVVTTEKKMKLSSEVLPYFRFWEIKGPEGSPLMKTKVSIEVHSLEPFKDFDINYNKSDNNGDDNDIEFF